ncbi:MAG: MBL fold metallo-hydrolase [Bacillota bacterium]
MHITWIGHATFLFRSGETAILTDPWFSRSLFYQRLKPPAMEADEISCCDIVLVSHAHGDHIDGKGLELAGRLGSLVVGPPSVVKKAKKMGLRYEAAEPGKTINAAGVKILVTPACHPAPGAKDAVGYILKIEEKAVYFAGDTLLFPELVDMLKDSVDLAILPIGPYKLLGRKVGMDVSEALKLIEETRPRAVVPMHYNCLKGTEADPDFLLKADGEAIRIFLLAPGETLFI